MRVWVFCGCLECDFVFGLMFGLIAVFGGLSLKWLCCEFGGWLGFVCMFCFGFMWCFPGGLVVGCGCGGCW